METIGEEIHDEFATHRKVAFRPVTIVNTGEKKKLTLRVEVPVEDMARAAETVEISSGPASLGPRSPSIWPAIHPRLLELIKSHTSTLIFVNSRRLAERLAAALNELAGEALVSAHHGSISRAQRVEIEDALKSGRLPALVATSSLELGIDMGAIDLVIRSRRRRRSPPGCSASGGPAIRWARHRAGSSCRSFAAISSPVPRWRRRCTTGPSNRRAIRAIRSTCCRSRSWPWWRSTRGRPTSCSPPSAPAAPFSELSRNAFDGVLDMLSGLYPSDEFAELRPRLTWDRVANSIVGAAGLEAHRHHQWRHHSRPRSVRRVPGGNGEESVRARRRAR